MKRYIKANYSDLLEDHYNEQDKCYLRLIYDVYQVSEDGKYRQAYQERTEYMPVYDALYNFGDWNYSGSYTTGFEDSPDGSETWFQVDVWIYSLDHPEMTHFDEAVEYDMLGPVGNHWKRSKFTD